MSSNKKLLQGASGFLNLSGSLNVEDVFSCDTYIGKGGTTATITNNIDLTGEGGLVWIKARNASEDHGLFDTARGVMKLLSSNTNSAEATNSGTLTNFYNNGFKVDGNGIVGSSTDPYVAWTFRKAPNFFDVVTYSGSSSTQSIAHNLGSVPGMIIVKQLNSSGRWTVWHRSLSTTNNTPYYGRVALNKTDAYAEYPTISSFQYLWGEANPTATHFTVGPHNDTSASGSNYVAYLFGHDTSDEGMIQCGNFTGTGSQITTTLGFEPQWLIFKRTDNSAGGGWGIVDNIRGWVEGGNSSNFQYIAANAIDSEAESSGPGLISTGFTSNHTNGREYIYMAIRRGPMATPTSRASVFAIGERGQDSPPPTYLANFPPDMFTNRSDVTGTNNWYTYDRLRGNIEVLFLDTNDVGQAFGGTASAFDQMKGIGSPTDSDVNNYSWMWRRSPKFFDIVAYTGNGSAGRQITHNLGVTPEMIWVKLRDSYTDNWQVYHSSLTSGHNIFLDVNSASADYSSRLYSPSSTIFTVSSDTSVNSNNLTYISYLWATLAGISKVGTFSHTNGSSTDVDCGFSSGSMLVIVKRTDASGDWYLWDSSRGIVSGNDPYLLINSSAAQNSSYDYIDPLNSGFQIASGFTTGTYLFYAIAS